MEQLANVQELIEYYESLELDDDDIDVCLFWLACGCQAIVRTFKDKPPIIDIGYTDDYE